MDKNQRKICMGFVRYFIGLLAAYTYTSHSLSLAILENLVKRKKNV